MSKAPQSVALLALVAAILVSNVALAADQCFNLRIVNVGQTITGTLAPNFPSCPQNLGFEVISKGAGTLTMGFGGAYTYTAPSVWTSSDFDKVILDVTCNVFDRVCDGGAQLYFKINRPAGTPAPSVIATPAPIGPTTPRPLTPAPSFTTLAPSTLAPTLAPPTAPPTPAPPVFCTMPPVITTGAGEIVTVDVSAYVSGCNGLSLALGPETDRDRWVATGARVIFDSTGANADNVYAAQYDVMCSGFTACKNMAVSVVIKSVVTAAPATLPPSSPPCGAEYIFEAPIGGTLAATVFSVDDADSCPTGALRTYRVRGVSQGSASSFRLLNDGSFTYTAPSSTVVDNFAFTMLCNAAPTCDATLRVVVSRAATPTPAPPVIPACKARYEVQIMKNELGTPVTGTLNINSVIEGICTEVSPVISIIRQPSSGSVAILGGATYSYTPDALGWDTFRVRFQCGVNNACEANVDAIVTPQPSGPPPTPVPETPQPTPVPSAFDNGNGIVCRGTCPSGAWRVDDGAAFAGSFDTNSAYQRADGKALDAVDYEIDAAGNLVVRVYGAIGNMGVRFPTFEPVVSDKRVTSAAAATRGAAFNASCLDLQSPFGVAFEVWEWTNSTTLDGRASSNYIKGESYFQKFGGKHDQCDVFMSNSCKYAPMLTPRNDGSSTGVSWTLDVNGCDITWVGVFAPAVILTLKRADGTNVFQRVGPNQLRAVLYTEAVKPSSWVFPSRGLLTTVKAVTLDVFTQATQDVVVEYIGTKVIETPAPTVAPVATSAPNATSASIDNANATDSATVLNVSTANTTTDAPVQPLPQRRIARAQQEGEPAPTTSVAPAVATPAPTPAPIMSFASDVQFYAYTAPGDVRMYGYNVVLYPRRGVNASDVPVVDVALVSHSWTRPSKAQCPQCVGSLAQCNGTGTGFADDCGDNAIVRLSAFSQRTNACVQRSRTNVTLPPPVAVPGVSDVDRCGNGYNITFRGIVPGLSTALSVGLAEGTVAVLVTFANGQQHRVTVTQAVYFAQLSADFSSQTCRSTYYWPVADPLGSTTPTTPYRTPADYYKSAEKDEAEGPATKEGRENATAAPPEAPVVISGPAFLNVPLVEKDGTLALCNAPDESVFFTTDWVYLSIGSDAGINATVEFITVAAPLSAVFPGRQTFAPETPFDRVVIALAGSRQGALPWDVNAAFLNFRMFQTSSASSFRFAFTPGTLVGAGAPTRVPITVEASLLDTATGKRTYMRRILIISSNLSPTVRGEKNVANEVIEEGIEITAENFAIILAFSLAGAVVAVGVIFVYCDESAKKIVLDQHTQMMDFMNVAVLGNLKKVPVLGIIVPSKLPGGSAPKQQAKSDAVKVVVTASPPKPASPSQGRMPEREQRRVADDDK